MVVLSIAPLLHFDVSFIDHRRHIILLIDSVVIQPLSPFLPSLPVSCSNIQELGISPTQPVCSNNGCVPRHGYSVGPCTVLCVVRPVVENYLNEL